MKMQILPKTYNPYPIENEAVQSEWGYPFGFQMLSLEKQVQTLKKYFPKLDYGHINQLAKYKLPDRADGWIIIPKLHLLANNYSEALKAAFELLSQVIKIENKVEDRFTDEMVSLNNRTAKAHEILNKQPGDFLVLPIQSGRLYRGKSPRLATSQFADNEFGICALMGTIFLLTHPDRIRPESLDIICPGTELYYGGFCGICCEFEQLPLKGEYGEFKLTSTPDLCFSPWSGVATGFIV